MEKIYAKVLLSRRMKWALVFHHHRLSKRRRPKIKASIGEKTYGFLMEVLEASGSAMDYMSHMGGFRGRTVGLLPSNQMAQKSGSGAFDKTWQVTVSNASRPVREFFAFDEKGIYKRNTEKEYKLIYLWEKIKAYKFGPYLFFYTARDYALIIPKTAFQHKGDAACCYQLWEKARSKNT